MIALKIVYVANVLVAGWISSSSILFPKQAARTIFSGAYTDSDLIRLVGCLWLGITILSLFGLFRPYLFAPVLLLQLIYKGTWLLVVAWPAIRNGIAYPDGMAFFFLIWVTVLPFIIPWGYLFGTIL